jgi:hypothetical protein
VYLFKQDPSAAMGWTQQVAFNPLIASGRTAITGDQFAHALSMDADSLVVGAPGDDTAGFLKAANATAVTSLGNTGTAEGYTDTGAVYVYKQSSSSWALEEILKPGNPHDDARAGMKFGQALAKAGEFIAVGAPFEDENASVISQCPTENEAYTRANNLVPCTLSLSSSANWADPTSLAGENSGAVYIFSRKEKTSWFPEAYLKPEDNSSNAQFGTALAFDGSYLAVATKDGTGLVYLFKRSCTSSFTQCWQQQQKLSSLDSAAADQQASLRFGARLGLWQNYLAVADPTSRGKVFIFKRGDDERWSLRQTIKDQEDGEFLGEQLAFSNGLLVLSKRSGTAQVYIRDSVGTWQLKQELTPSGGLAAPTLAIHSTKFRIVLGLGVDGGSAFVFE